MKSSFPIALIILDGFGCRAEKEANGVALAHTPTLDYLCAHYPHTILQASGIYVGLDPNYEGNSEVGHLTLGAGRRIEQIMTRINRDIKTGAFFKNPLLTDALKLCVQKNSTLHIMGLLSDAGDHSNETHLFAYIKAAVEAGVKRIIVHAFLDGRDVYTQSATIYLKRLDAVLQEYPQAQLASLTGRFYAMDRDNHWERIEKAYQLLTTAIQPTFTNWKELLDYYYHQNITDEYIPPTCLIADSYIKPGDGVIFFNTRPDRARELTEAFVNKDFSHFNRPFLPLSFFITPVSYRPDLKTIALYKVDPVYHTLKEELSDDGLTLFSIAETEKYAHVTYFFGGGKETPIKNETQKLIPSLRIEHFDKEPQMSAAQITKTVVATLDHPYNFYLINYANADIVGHTAILDATIKAVECLDEQLKVLYDQIVIKHKGTLYITSDHGNAEYLVNSYSGHTTNPVPFIMVNLAYKDSSETLNLHELADVAPFILENAGLPVPAVMRKKDLSDK